jgi:hypothetical protein
MKDTTKKEEEEGEGEEGRDEGEEAEAESILDTRRTDEVNLPIIPASESTEVSDTVDMFITDLNYL